MTDISAHAELARRVRELEAENAALTRGRSVLVPTGRRWRAWASAVSIVVASILVPVSILGVWASSQLLNEDLFAQTLAPIVDDASVQELIIDETMSAVHAQVDFAQLTDTLFDSFADLGVSPTALNVLNLLRGPAADSLGTLVESSVTTVVESAAFSDVWETSVRGAHRTLTVASTTDGGGVVVFVGTEVGIALGPLVEAVKGTLADNGLAAAAFIPTVDRTVVLGDGQALLTLRAAYSLIPVVGWGLPLVTLALFGAGIAFARRRDIGVVGAGLGIAAGAATLGVALSVGFTVVSAQAAGLDLSPSALSAIYGQLISSLLQVTWAVAVLGAFCAAAGWAMGRFVPARRLRAAIRSGNAAARRAFARHGFHTGALGRWLAQHRVAVRFAITALMLLGLCFLYPLTVGSVLLTALVALVLYWLLELLQRRPDEQTDDEHTVPSLTAAADKGPR